jgi:hypothetical protein
VKPAFLVPRTLRDEVEDDVAHLRALALEQRGKIVESVCRDAMAYGFFGAARGTHDRGTDLVDVERLIGLMQRELDTTFVRQALVEVVGEGDHRMLKWDALVVELVSK